MEKLTILEKKLRLIIAVAIAHASTLSVQAELICFARHSLVLRVDKF